jgi:hypothetical protein
VSGPGDSGRPAAVTARPLLPGPGWLAAADGAQDGPGLRQHVPPEWGQRGNAERHEDRDRGHGGHQAQPLQLPLVPGTPVTLTGAAGPARCAR